MSKSSDLVAVHVDERGVGTITLQRPKRGNSIVPEMGERVKQALKQMADQGVRVVILSGSGKYFSTGMDLGAANQSRLQGSLKDGAGSGDDSNPANGALSLFEAIAAAPMPVIAAMNGPAFGGGAGIALACDIRVMVPSAFLCFSEVWRGIAPALISAYCVPVLGASLASQLMLTGRRFTAAEAKQTGVCSSVASDNTTEALRAAVEKEVEMVLKGGPAALCAVKRLVRHVSHHTHEENVEYVKSMFLQMMSWEEAAHGIGAFAARQQPDWARYAAANSTRSRL